MKIAAIIFIVIAMIGSLISGLSYSVSYETFVEILRESGLNFALSKEAFLATIWVYVVLVLAAGGISLYFLAKAKPNRSAILALGIVDIFFCSLLAGIFMIVYANQLQNAERVNGPYYYGQPFPGPTKEEMPTHQEEPKAQEERSFFAVGDAVLLLDDSKGVIVAIEDGVATVRPDKEGVNYVKIALTALRRP